MKKSIRLVLEKRLKSFFYPTYEVVDSRVSYKEIRYIAIGRNSRMIIITVIYTEREDKIRIISARRSNNQEKTLYYEYWT